MSPSKECVRVSTLKVPEPIQSQGHPVYSLAVKHENTVYLSGQLGIDAITKTLVDGVTAQTEVALKNIGHILEAAGSSYEQVLKVTVYLADINDFPDVNKIYVKYFSKNPPARTAFQAGALPLGGKVEIELIAATNSMENKL